MSAPRSEYISSLRQLADWLAAHPDMPVPSYRSAVNLPVLTNAAVEEFATTHAHAVVYDSEGNASVSVSFGSIDYHVYGYMDFEAHVAASNERDARQWADEHGVDLVRREPGVGRPQVALAKREAVVVAGEQS